MKTERKKIRPDYCRPVSDYLLSGVEDCGGCGYEPQMEESPSAGYDAGMRKKPVVGSGIWRFKKLWEKSQHLYLYERWNPGYPAGRGASMPISCQRQTVPSGFGVWGFDSLGNLHDISEGSAPVCRS